MAGELLRAKNACGQKGDWSSWRPRHVRDLENTFAAIMATSTRPTGDPANANEAGDDEPPPKNPPVQASESRMTENH